MFQLPVLHGAAQMHSSITLINQRLANGIAGMSFLRDRNLSLTVR
jgi:hypothetical protein